MKTYKEIENILRQAAVQYEGVRIGIAGSYANNTQTKKSDIDVVIDGDSSRNDIAEHIKNLFFDENVDVLWLELMREEDEELDRLAISIGVPINENSVFKTVIREVSWIEKWKD